MGVFATKIKHKTKIFEEFWEPVALDIPVLPPTPPTMYVNGYSFINFFSMKCFEPLESE